MEMEIVLNFEKTYISKSIGTVLLENLPPNEVETLNRILQGKKAQYKEANGLLFSILRAMENRGEEEELEFEIAERNETQEPSRAELLEQAGSSQNNQQQEQEIAPNTNSIIPKKDNTNSRVKKEICRFYARGKCNRSKDCQFGHPEICKKFRLLGSKSTNSKGCDGKCDRFHPNACRSSLLNKTCSFSECRFFHLKGTRLSNPNQSEPDGRDWRGNIQPKNHQNLRPGPHGLQSESKNWRRHNPEQNPNPQAGNASKEDPVSRDEDKILLNQTLEAIMKRLTAMEARSPMYLHPTMNSHQPGIPIPSPTVQQPGTQTQMQWGSPKQWPQTQY